MLSTSDPQSGIETSASAQSLDASELQLVGKAVLDHLHQESAYLDTVIACSSKMTELLKQSSFSKVSTTDRSTSNLRDLEPVDSINRIKIDLANSFAPIVAGRKTMHSVLDKLNTNSPNAASLRELATLLDAPVRDELYRLRNEIRDKLQEVQTITLGNQAVLIYTLDFYHRMMMGITGETMSAYSYNANGQMTQSPAGHLVEKKC